MTFAWIHEHKSWAWSTQCQALNVTRSGLYAFAARQKHSKPSPRSQRHQALCEQVRLSYLRSRGAYGAPRITAELKGQGTAVCVNSVAKILRECGLKARRRRRFFPPATDSDHPHPIAPNLLNRSFKVDRPDAVWVGDISCIPTAQGWLHLATLMDLFSRKIVGWQMADHARADLICDALRMAVDRRTPPTGLICHSDRGVQYASRQYRSLLKQHGIVCSMSRRGDCYDNAPAESFFATLKGELIDAHTYLTREQAKAAVFEFIEVFYNRKRLHSALGYKSPEQFEADHRASPNTAPTESG